MYLKALVSNIGAAGYWMLASRSDRLIMVVTLMPTIFDSWMESRLTTGDGPVRLRAKGARGPTRGPYSVGGSRRS